MVFSPELLLFSSLTAVDGAKALVLEKTTYKTCGERLKEKRCANLKSAVQYLKGAVQKLKWDWLNPSTC